LLLLFAINFVFILVDIQLIISSQLISIIFVGVREDLSISVVIVNINSLLVKVKHSFPDLLVCWLLVILFKFLSHFFNIELLHVVIEKCESLFLVEFFVRE